MSDNNPNISLDRGRYIASQFELGPVPFGTYPIDLEDVSGRLAYRNTAIEAIDYEFADEERGLKVVYVGTREDGETATFETGSFFDNGGVEGAPDRHDICVSTAGGCTRSCEFCSVPKAALGFERLLTSDEIAAQVIHTINLRNPTGSVPNVVGIMGNGEPPDNLALIPAIRMLDATGLIARFTISTIGEHRQNIGKLATAFAGLRAPLSLQLSLHSADDAKRRLIIPGRASVAAVMAASDDFADKTGQAVKHNVVLMDGTGRFDGFSNATESDARKLAHVLKAPSASTGEPMRRRLKMSAFNPVPGIPFTTPSEEARARFVQILREEGITEIKTFKGSGIEIDSAHGLGGFACGQLRANTTAIALARKPATQTQEVWRHNKEGGLCAA